jgi:putative CocE/NonD family hydrolase
MFRILLLGAMLSLAPVHAAASEQQPAVAESLIPTYANSTDAKRISTLMRLQLDASRWQDAERSAERLTEVYRRTQPERAFSVMPWRIYARARRYRAEGPSWPDALRRAFAELYGSLPDREVARTYGWMGGNMDALRQSLAQAEKACPDEPMDRCDGAADIIAARQSIIVWEHLQPALQPLLRADLDRRFIVDDKATIPTPDGGRIAAILVRPRNPAKVTSLLDFTIYANDFFATAGAVEMAGNGYAGMTAYSRGKEWSPGPAMPYEKDGADAAAVVDWLAAQPWSDGRVGMFSGSYDASTQWGALKHHPRALKAIATHASNAPGIDTPIQGNVFQSFIYPWPHYTTDSPALDDINYGDSDRWSALNRKWYVSGRPYRDLPLIDGQPNPIFEKWLEHPAYDSYWKSFIPVGDEFGSIDIPVFVETGYFDGGMVGALYYFEQHLKYRPDADDRILIGPYHHTAMGQGVLPTINGYSIDEVAMQDLRGLRLKWFDHVFHGAPLPDVLSDRVNFEVMGANEWRHAHSLDAMADERRRLYLGGKREGDRLLFEGAPNGHEPAPKLRVDFSDRSDADYQVPDSGFDTRNALVFTTTALAEPEEIDGLFHGRLQVVTNKRDFDLAVNFFEQKADGSYFPLASYLGRASFMADRSHRHLLTPGQPTLLDFESQMLTARQLAAGSRIVAVVAVPKQPEIQINYGTGRDVSDESIADAKEPLLLTFGPSSYLELGFHR